MVNVLIIISISINMFLIIGKYSLKCVSPGVNTN